LDDFIEKGPSQFSKKEIVNTNGVTSDTFQSAPLTMIVFKYKMLKITARNKLYFCYYLF